MQFARFTKKIGGEGWTTTESEAGDVFLTIPGLGKGKEKSRDKSSEEGGPQTVNQRKKFVKV